MSKSDRPNNLPGQDAIDYRVGTYTELVRRMENLARKPMLPGKDGLFPNGLKNLGVSGRQDLAVALIKSWAAVGDVLTFYQERIANEGYLRTARERKSVMELVNSIGYRLTPGLSAGTYLAFKGNEAKGNTAPSRVPKGTAVQGMPAGQKKPVTFETETDVEVRTEWNAIKVYVEKEEKPPLMSGYEVELVLDKAQHRVKPGTRLLISGYEASDKTKKTKYFLRTVAKAEINKKKQITHVQLTPISDEKEGGIHPRLLDVAIYVFRQEAPLFGYNAASWENAKSREKQKTGTVDGGLFYTENQGKTWTPAEKGLIDRDIRAVIYDKTGGILAGTDKGVYRSADRGKTWKAVNTGIMKRDVHSMFVDQFGYIYIGCSSGGSFRSSDNGLTWDPIQDGLVIGKEHNVGKHFKVLDSRAPRTVIRSIAGYTDPETGDSYIFAGTDQGIMRTVNRENVWEPANHGLPGENKDSGMATCVVHCLTYYKDGSHIFAGTDKGLFLSKNHGKSWESLDKKIKCTDVFSLMYVHRQDTDGSKKQEKQAHYVIAGTDSGVYWSNDDGAGWTRLSVGALPVEKGSDKGEAGPPVRVLTHYIHEPDKKTYMLAATDDGIYITRDFGQTWMSLDTSRVGDGIQAMAVDSNGLLVVGASFKGYKEADWPGYGVTGQQVDLVRARTGIVPETWLALTQDKPEPHTAICNITKVTKLVRKDFGRTARVFRLDVDGCDGLDKFDLRQARAFAQAEEVPLLLEETPGYEAVTGKRILLNGQHHFEEGHLLLITGKRSRSGKEARVVRAVEGVDVSDDKKYTAVMLDRDVELTLEPAGTTVCANVVYATEGETVNHEVLGSGSGADTNQQFKLKKPPLTYVSADNAEGGQSTLSVHITSGPPHGYLDTSGPDRDLDNKGVEWTEVKSLYEAGPMDRVFMVHTDENDDTYVTFGDGSKGSRLPTGHENVCASYRSGSGETGNVDADTLSMMRHRPRGVRKVSNPLPADGGTAPESIADARVNGPRDIRTLDRIVSLDDYRDFAANFAGIAKAAVKRLQYRGTRYVHITAAGSGGTAVAADSPLYRNLMSSLHSYRAVEVPLILDNYEEKTFHLSARATVLPGYDIEAVKASLEKRLTDAFSFQRRELGQPVSASDIIAAARGERGVKALSVEELYPHGSKPAYHFALTAYEARWDLRQDKILPAQLLVLFIDQNGPGIDLTMERA